MFASQQRYLLMQSVRDPFVDLEERLEATLAAAGASGSWDWDIPADRLYLDARMSALYGIPLSDDGVPTETFFAPIHPEDVARIKVAVAGMVHGAELFAKSFRLLAADGTVRWMEAHGRCFYDAEDRPKRFSGILVDVTARRRTEEQLRIAQTAGGVGTFEHVAGYATAAVSEQFCRVLGLNPATALPVATINSVVQPGFEPLLGQDDDQAFSNAEVCIVRRNDGEHRWITRRGETVCDAETAGVRRIGVIYDITERRNRPSRAQRHA